MIAFQNLIFVLLSDVYSHRINFQHNYLQLLFQPIAVEIGNYTFFSKIWSCGRWKILMESPHEL